MANIYIGTATSYLDDYMVYSGKKINPQSYLGSVQFYGDISDRWKISDIKVEYSSGDKLLANGSNYATVTLELKKCKGITLFARNVKPTNVTCVYKGENLITFNETTGQIRWNTSGYYKNNVLTGGEYPLYVAYTKEKDTTIPAVDELDNSYTIPEYDVIEIDNDEDDVKQTVNLQGNTLTPTYNWEGIYVTNSNYTNKSKGIPASGATVSIGGTVSKVFNWTTEEYEKTVTSKAGQLINGDLGNALYGYDGSTYSSSSPYSSYGYDEPNTEYPYTYLEYEIPSLGTQLLNTYGPNGYGYYEIQLKDYYEGVYYSSPVISLYRAANKLTSDSPSFSVGYSTSYSNKVSSYISIAENAEISVPGSWNNTAKPLYVIASGTHKPEYTSGVSTSASSIASNYLDLYCNDTNLSPTIDRYGNVSSYTCWSVGRPDNLTTNVCMAMGVSASGYQGSFGFDFIINPGTLTITSSPQYIKATDTSFDIKFNSVASDNTNVSISSVLVSGITGTSWNTTTSSNVHISKVPINSTTTSKNINVTLTNYEGVTASSSIVQKALERTFEFTSNTETDNVTYASGSRTIYIESSIDGNYKEPSVSTYTSNCITSISGPQYELDGEKHIYSFEVYYGENTGTSARSDTITFTQAYTGLSTATLTHTLTQTYNNVTYNFALDMDTVEDIDCVTSVSDGDDTNEYTISVIPDANNGNIPVSTLTGYSWSDVTVTATPSTSAWLSKGSSVSDGIDWSIPENTSTSARSVLFNITATSTFGTTHTDSYALTFAQPAHSYVFGISPSKSIVSAEVTSYTVNVSSFKDSAACDFSVAGSTYEGGSSVSVELTFESNTSSKIKTTSFSFAQIGSTNTSTFTLTQQVPETVYYLERVTPSTSVVNMKFAKSDNIIVNSYSTVGDTSTPVSIKSSHIVFPSTNAVLSVSSVAQSENQVTVIISRSNVQTSGSCLMSINQYNDIGTICNTLEYTIKYSRLELVE